ncbi:MAG: hydroxyphenylacetyl-CoA thioesterase PaaI [Phyllobacteriaceae bacterium]|nr:hydroxyphenylacetyl-CoA thioesterase PaaI [Phyllobacteriaceae bacterium]
MTKPHRDPQATAELAARTMWAADEASRGLGARLVAVGPGTATLEMPVRRDMTNGHDTAHGGFIFALADSTFAFACNSAGETTVAAHCSITYLRPAHLGDLLVATAREVESFGRSGIWDVTVRVGDTVVAEFRGHSRKIGGSFIDPPATV